MGLLRFVKAASAKIFGATETAAAPPERWEQDAEKSRLDVAQVEVKPAGKVVLSDSTAAKEEARENQAGDRRSGRCCHGPRQYRGGRRSRRIEVFYTVQPSDTLGKIAGPNMAPATPANIIGLFKPISLCCPMPTRSIQPSAADSSASG